MTENIVIIGAGQAGFSTAARLRALNDKRPIVLLGAEPVPPYQRPPLSKKYLLGEMDFDRLLLRPEAWYRDNAIDLHLNTSAVAIDRKAKEVVLHDGGSVAYDKLVLATGAAPRRLPAELGGDLEGVFVMREKSDADRLAGLMKRDARMLVVGGGYVGLEAAAVARKFGCSVTLIEMTGRILSRVASAQTADIMRDIHLSHGVDIRENTALISLSGTDGRVCGALLSDGCELPVDIVVVGIGVTPNVTLAQAAGLETANGIVVDAFCRTSDPDILAIGDCAALPFCGKQVRFESVPNAIEQGEVAAAILCGADLPYSPEPWFWSDQYDVKLQIAGYNDGYDLTVVRSGQREGSLSVWYFRADKLLAVDAINDARAYVCGKKMLATGISPSSEQVADPQTDLKALLI